MRGRSIRACRLVLGVAVAAVSTVVLVGGAASGDVPVTEVGSYVPMSPVRVFDSRILNSPVYAASYAGIDLGFTPLPGYVTPSLCRSRPLARPPRAF